MTPPKKSRWTAVGAAGSLALAAGLAPTAFAAEPEATFPGQPPRAPVVGLSLLGENLSLGLTDGQGAEAPAGFTVGPEARTTVPADGARDFLGEAGHQVWVLGDGAASTAPEPGADPAPRWDTTAVDAGALDGADTVHWSLTGVEGPGDVTVFDPAHTDAATGTAGGRPQVLFDSSDGLSDTDTHDLAAGSSGRVAWAFTEPGEYRLTSRASATLESGAPVTTTAQWTVRVADAPLTPPADSPAPLPTAPSVPEAPERSLAEPSATTLVKEAPGADGIDIQNQRIEIGDGHVDAIAGHMVGGRLRTLFKDSRDAGHVVWREPSSVVVRVVPGAKEKIPDNSTYGFLGAPGSDFWLIPQVQKQGVVWAGWNTEALDTGDLKGPVKMAMEKVTGPGSVAIWETAGLGGADVLYNSRDGLPDTRQVDLGVHAHANWAFSKEGTYEVTFRLSGTLPKGAATSDAQTYTFVVGDGAPDTGGTGGAGTGQGTGSGDDPTDGSAGTGGGGGGTSGGSAGAGSGSGSGSGSTGGTSPGGSAGSDASEGSLAHTGSGPALPLAAGAGALVVSGAAAMALTRSRRRRADGATP
ncbi:choice-of-anchor M domain-containing protein [Streptomyces sp. NPDC003717]|uniref:choice-of-anchor M domain-containing protein n=1 Tax=Streptomyces sp. NPDC003717 TaxID=3154276 RepID=UPI0033A3B050